MFTDEGRRFRGIIMGGLNVLEVMKLTGDLEDVINELTDKLDNLDLENSSEDQEKLRNVIKGLKAAVAIL
jgi:hypothetical protein